MNKETFTNPALIAYMNQNFIPIKVDSDRESALAQRYRVQGLPTSLFLTDKGEQIARQPGFVTADKLLQIMQYILKDNSETSLKKEHFKDTATIKDDSLSTIAEITTTKGFPKKLEQAGVVYNDNFLRAFINKKTGQTTIQVYQVIYYTGHGWNFFQTVNYETPNGPESCTVNVIKRDFDCHRGVCLYEEHIGFDVDEKLLRVIAACYQPGQSSVWKFKLNAKSGNEYYDSMMYAEIAGFLECIDEYRKSHSLISALPK
jgi:hypothetical protein